MNKKSCSFIAYIDESGDIGIKPEKGGSSQWFGLAAFIVRANQDIQLVEYKRKIVTTCKLGTPDIHMKEIKNEDKRRYIASCVANFDSRCVVVLSNKKSLYNQGVFLTKDSYYQYMCRYLLERITNCCAGWHDNSNPDGNGKVKIVFATRGGMDYDALKSYLYTLKDSPAVNEKIEKQKLPKIKWDVIDIDEVQNIPAEKRVGLQFADVLSYSFFKAVNKNDYHMVNTEYCVFFMTRMYSCENRIWHNGVTVVNVSQIENDRPAELEQLFRQNINKARLKKQPDNREALGNFAKIEKWKKK